jgi:hypothetical protein
MEGVLERMHRVRVMPGHVGIGALAASVQGCRCRGECRAVSDLEASLRAQARDARVSEIPIGEREQAGEFLS